MYSSSSIFSLHSTFTPLFPHFSLAWPPSILCPPKPASHLDALFIFPMRILFSSLLLPTLSPLADLLHNFLFYCDIFTGSSISRYLSFAQFFFYFPVHFFALPICCVFSRVCLPVPTASFMRIRCKRKTITQSA
jgi:hypothetical protein